MHIGTHLARFNLFREPDGSLHITIVEGIGAKQEDACKNYPTPHAYILTLVERAVVSNVHSNLNAAHDRIFDILNGDDGQAWSEAERYLKANAPELYNRLQVQKGVAPTS